jgi:hypothetical protein
MNYYEITYETIDFEENSITESMTVVGKDIIDVTKEILKTTEIKIDEIIAVEFDSIVHK